jgi:PqqA peptide cyclase
MMRLMGKGGIRFGTSILKNLLGRKTILLLQLKITFRCSMNCPYCQVHSFGTRLYPKKNEMTPEEIGRVMVKYAKRGAAILNITGGEPLQRADLPEILKHAKDAGYYVVLNTDGTKIHDFLSDSRFRKGIDMLRVSVDSPSDHDTIRGSKKRLPKILKNIMAARSAGIPTTINSVITKQNFKDMEPLCKLSGKLGCPITLTPANGHEYTVSSALQNASRFEDLDRRIFVKEVRSLKKKYALLSAPEYFLNHLIHKEDINKSCDFLSYVATVLPDGKMALPCEIFVSDTMDVKDADLEKVYSSEKLLDYKKKTGKMDVCVHCETRCATYPQSILNISNLIEMVMNRNL